VSSNPTHHSTNAQYSQASTANPKEIFPGEVFAHTTDFDSGIRQLLPRYDEMLDAIALCIPAHAQRILDLGCGTGEVSLKILQRFPTAQVVAIDYSPRMIEFAKGKVEAAGYGQQWTGIEGDFGDWANHQLAIADGFDACVSSLAIHHLTHEMKLQLFSRIRESLNPDGVFWNADPVLPESPALSEAYQTIREQWAAQQGTTLAEIRAKMGKSTPYGYSQPDQLATLEAHLQMLKTAGFEPVAVPWKYYGLAVFGGSINN
jgi:tRNA (cmo5U34)-methyltransferase